MKKIYLFIFVPLLFTGCKPDIGIEAGSAGEADFSSYVALGNSLTAGFADGTLYKSGQENSYPNMLAMQFRTVGGGVFRQPLLPGEAGWPSLKRVLGYSTDCNGEEALFPVTFNGTPDTAGSRNSIAAQGPFHNLGVPGIRVVDYFTAGYALFNPYAARFYNTPASRKPIEEAQRINHTFFSIWLGSNDILGYALAGGTGGIGGPSTNDISDITQFSTAYTSIVATMTANGARGVLVNIPDITAIPFFTTVPAKGLELTEEQAAQLNDAFAGTGEKFHPGANYFMVEDNKLLSHRRRIKDGELILLSVPLDSIKCHNWGTVIPIPDRYFLDLDEINEIKKATQDFNKIILDNAAKHNLAFADMNAYLNTVQSGINFNGVDYSTTFATGGIFSLDGIHLTPRGYALAANEIIRAINSRYNATVPMIDANKYEGIRLP